jgi:hypothetical protein
MSDPIDKNYKDVLNEGYEEIYKRSPNSKPTKSRGGRRRSSKKHPTARRRRSSKARKSRSTRRR